MNYFIQLGIGLFTAGVAWGVIKATLNGTNKRLDQHIEDTRIWRAEVATQLTTLTQALIK